MSPTERIISKIRDNVIMCREELGLIQLTPKERQSYLGKWMSTGHEFAGRAALQLQLGEAQLAHVVPYSPEDILSQRDKVLVAEHAHLYYSQLAKQAADTVLKERSKLHGMSMGVLRASEWVCSQPFHQGTDLMPIQAGVNHLRHFLDKKNQKISRTKRRAAAAASSAGPAAATTATAGYASAATVMPAAIVIPAAPGFTAPAAAPAAPAVPMVTVNACVNITGAGAASDRQDTAVASEHAASDRQDIAVAFEHAASDRQDTAIASEHAAGDRQDTAVASEPAAGLIATPIAALGDENESDRSPVDPSHPRAPREVASTQAADTPVRELHEVPINKSAPAPAPDRGTARAISATGKIDRDVKDGS